MSKFRFRSAGRAPESRASFRFSQDAVFSSDVMRGVHTVRSTAGVSLVLPQFDKKHPLTVRILPALNPETGEIMPYRYTPEHNDFTDWIRQAQVASYVGQPQYKKTFILYDQRKIRQGYDPDRNPYNVLYWAFRTALKEGVAYVGSRNVMTTYWAALNEQQALRKPRAMYWVQGLIYANGDQLYVQKGAPPRGASQADSTPVIQLPTSAGQALCEALNLVKEEFRGGTDNFNDIFVYPDITDPVNGRFVTFYNPAVHDIGMITSAVSSKAAQAAITEERDDPSGRFSSASREDDFKRYEVAIHEKFCYLSGGAAKYRLPDISHYNVEIHWWDNVLHYPTDEEIALWLVQAFPSFPELFAYAWKDCPWFFTDDVKAVLRNRVQVATIFQEPVQKQPAEAPAISTRESGSATFGIPSQVEVGQESAPGPDQEFEMPFDAEQPLVTAEDLPPKQPIQAPFRPASGSAPRASSFFSHLNRSDKDSDQGQQANVTPPAKKFNFRKPSK